MRPVGAKTTPTLEAVNGTQATYATRTTTTSSTTMTKTKELAVPMSSQMIHKGEYPSGVAAARRGARRPRPRWSCATSARARRAADYSWTSYQDGYVDHAARYTFDYAYDGTGNWPFNTAYAARHSLDAFVTRLYTLRDAEAFIKAGIPLVASIAFGKGELDGAPITSTPGHLLVIRGFTSAGSVIVNDPAASKNSTVRRVYSRAQFEKAWQRGSGGVVYVIRPDQPGALPARHAPAGERQPHSTVTLIFG